MSLQQITAAPRPVIVVLCPERILVDRATKSIRTSIEPSAQPAAFNVTRARGDADLAGALASARSAPVLAARRYVEISSIEAASSSSMALLVEYMERPCDSTILLVTGTGWPAVTKGGRAWHVHAPKALAAGGGTLWKIPETDPVAFCTQEATQRGATLPHASARALVDVVGPSLSLLHHEVEKLCLSADIGATLTVDMVYLSAVQTSESEIWGLTTAITLRQPAAAMVQLRRLMDEGNAPHRVMYAVVSQIRAMLRAADMIRSGADDEAIRAATRLRSAAVASLRQEVRVGFPGAAALMAGAARVQRRMQSTRAADEHHIQTWIAGLAAR